MTPTVEDLQAENAWLREKQAEMAGEAKRAAMLAVLGLTPQQGGILAVLLANPLGVKTERIYSEVFEDLATGDGPDLKIVKVQIHNLRQRLKRKKAKGAIQTVREFGYVIDPDLRRWIEGQMRAFAERLAA